MLEVLKAAAFFGIDYFAKISLRSLLPQVYHKDSAQGTYRKLQSEQVKSGKVLGNEEQSLMKVSWYTATSSYQVRNPTPIESCELWAGLSVCVGPDSFFL